MNTHKRLRPSEFKAGWHWCYEWDGLLVGPGMGELAHCQCHFTDQNIEVLVNRLRDEARALLETEGHAPICDSDLN